MSTTPGRKLRVFVGGNRTVVQERATWITYIQSEIAPDGNEREDGTVFVPGIGYRLTDARMFGELGYERAADKNHVYSALNGNAVFAIYSDDSSPVDDSDNPRYNQRAYTELGIDQGEQSLQGDQFVRKHARKLGGLGSDWLAHPPPNSSDPVPLDRVMVGGEPIDADDKVHVQFKIFGNGSQTKGPLVRIYFTQLAGLSGADLDANTYGTGKYCLLLSGDGTARLYEAMGSYEGPVDGSFDWKVRKSFKWCERDRVIGNTHSVFIESNAKKDASDNFFGDTIRFGFSSAHTWGPGFHAKFAIESLVQAQDQVGSLGGGVIYKVPTVSGVNVQPEASPLRIDGRQDCQIDFQAFRKFYYGQTLIGDEAVGKVKVRTFSLKQAPYGGRIHVQVYGYFPAGTGTTVELFEAESGQPCAVVETIADDVAAKNVDFEPKPGKRGYRLVVTLTSSSDRLHSPTVERVAIIREASHRVVEENVTELQNVTFLTTTGAGPDPSTETLALRCWDLTGLQNAILSTRSGMPIWVEADLGDGPLDPEAGPTRLRSVLFRGKIVQARRRVFAGKRKRGFSQTGEASKGPLVCYTVKAVSEWERLKRRLAPGRIDLAFDGAVAGVVGNQQQANRVTDIVRFLLEGILGKARVHVPHVDRRLPLDQDFTSQIEKFQPILPIVVELVQKFLGGYLIRDDNASYPEDHENGPTEEGVWRVMISPKTSALKPVAEFWPEPVVEGTNPVHPGSYPDAIETTGEGVEATSRPIPRTFLRQSAGDDWIQPPECNQVVVRGVGKPVTAHPIAVSTSVALEVCLNNWPTAKFMGEPHYSEKVAAGMPPENPDHPDYTDGDIVTFEHSSPDLNTAEAVLFIARRAYDMKCHARHWHTGESPLIFLSKETTMDPLQARPRPLRFGDPVTVKQARRFVTEGQTGVVEADGLYILDAGPSILTDGEQGGSAFQHAYYAMFSAPIDDTYKAAYGEMY